MNRLNIRIKEPCDQQCCKICQRHWLVAACRNPCADIRKFWQVDASRYRFEKCGHSNIETGCLLRMYIYIIYRDTHKHLDKKMLKFACPGLHLSIIVNARAFQVYYHHPRCVWVKWYLSSRKKSIFNHSTIIVCSELVIISGNVSCGRVANISAPFTGCWGAHDQYISFCHVSI